MNRIAVKIIFPLVVLIIASQARAQAVDQVRLDDLIADSMKKWRVPGAAVVVVRGDEVVYLKGFGVKDLKTKEPVTPDTIFAIGSTTKAFTTAAMAMLVDDGKMNWDDPVRKHIAWFKLGDPLASENVTMRDLVTHRTGLSRHDMLWYGSPWSRDEIIRKIGYVPLTQSFRSVFQYQNIMFLAAGQSVGAAAKTTFEDFVRKRIFDPLGMSGSNLSVIDAEKAPDHATPHMKKGAGIEPMPWRNIDNVGPAGSINSSVRDLAKWIRMQLSEGSFEGKRVISPASIREMHAPQMVIRLEGRWKLFFPESDVSQLSYGLGWFINDYRGHKLVMHGGTIDGFRASIVLAPSAKAGVAVLANLNATQMPEAACYNIIDHMLGLPAKDWNAYIAEQARKFEIDQMKSIAARMAARKKDTKPSRELVAYTGYYDDPGYGRATISIESESLVLQWSNFKTRLDHFHFDTFTPKTEQLLTEQITFTLGADGEIDSMNLFGVNFKKSKIK